MGRNEIYENRVFDLLTDLNRKEKRSTLFSWMRLLVVVCIIGCIIGCINTDKDVLFIAFMAILVLVFLRILKLDLKLHKVIQLLKLKIDINRDEIRSINFDFGHRDTGDKFMEVNPFLANDFDLFGVGSLYQYINRCRTKLGKAQFAKHLCFPSKDSKQIYLKQKAIHELSGMQDFLEEFQAKATIVSENEDKVESFQNWVLRESVEIEKERTVSFYIIAINILFIVLSLMGIIKWGFVLLSGIFAFYYVKKHSENISNSRAQLNKATKFFDNYKDLFELFEKQSFDSEYLNMLKKKLSLGDKSASNSIKSLSKILVNFEVSESFILSYLLNSILLWDFHVYHSLLKWKKDHDKYVNDWFFSLSELESLISFSIFSYNNDQIVYPSISNEQFCIKVEDICHPLIPPNERVYNSFESTCLPSAIIITGANMAGKSTFLRTVATNLLLAMNGAPVVAKMFCFTPCNILSSIRVQDSLTNKASYFYAELVRLRAILDFVDDNSRTLIILDEVLRGTNSKDKQLGTLGLIEKLITKNSMLIIATHDLSIGELEYKYPRTVQNYNFEVELIDEQLYFDYKLKEGICKKLNASFLMRKMDIID